MKSLFVFRRATAYDLSADLADTSITAFPYIVTALSLFGFIAAGKSIIY